MNEKKFNKGDWSEFYAFLKILSDRKICGADKKLEKIEDVFYPIKKILRTEGKKNIVYDISDEHFIQIVFPDRESMLINPTVIKSSVKTIFNKINDSKGGLEVFDEAKILMEHLHCSTIKADKSHKADIKVIMGLSQIPKPTPVNFL